MAIVVESTSTASASTTTTVTIPKPTGLQSGDYMIAILSGAEADGGGIGSWEILSGWGAVENNTFGGALAQCVQVKEADAGDAAASDFTFTISASTIQVHGSILRCSGAAIDYNVADAIADSSTYSGVGVSSATFAGTHSSFTPGANGALVIAMYGIEFASGGATRTFGSYTVTSGVTLTELYDSGTNDGSGGAYYSATYGVQATATALSAYGATISTSSNDHYGTFVIFTPPVDASGSNTLVTTTSATFNQTGIADGIIGNTLATATAETFVQGGTAMTDTQWSNPSKPSSTWTNTSKI